MIVFYSVAAWLYAVLCGFVMDSFVAFLTFIVFWLVMFVGTIFVEYLNGRLGKGNIIAPILLIVLWVGGVFVCGALLFGGYGPLQQAWDATNIAESFCKLGALLGIFGLAAAGGHVASKKSEKWSAAER